MPTKNKSAANKTAAKKTAVKKNVTPKKASVKSSNVTTKAKKVPAIKSVDAPMTKTQLFSAIAEEAEVTKKDVVAVFDALEHLINVHVKKKGPGAFTLPNILKIKAVHKPATKARKGVNPFTGEEAVFKAKPARNVIKVQPLKKLKEMAN